MYSAIHSANSCLLGVCLKDSNFLIGKPNSISVVSTNPKFSPKIAVRTSDEAPETTECPLVYSGKGGVCKIGFQSLSNTLLINVSGRIKLLLYFSSQQLINASAIAIVVLV